MEDKIKVLGDRALGLGSIREHRGWKALREEFERKKERHVKTFTSNCITGADPVNQREVDMMRGFWAGCQWLLDNPEQAEETLDRALRKLRSDSV